MILKQGVDYEYKSLHNLKYKFPIIYSSSVKYHSSGNIFLRKANKASFNFDDSEDTFQLM